LPRNDAADDDNGKIESFMKTLKVEAVYLGDYEMLRRFAE
jgi:hypothetical protein